MTAPRWLRRGGRMVVVAAIVLAILELAMGWMLRARVSQPLERTDRIEVAVVDREPFVVTDPAVIAQVRSFVAARPDGWTKTWHTPPVTRVDLTFLRGDVFVGRIGSGSNFFRAPAVDGGEATRTATDAELAAFHALLGLPPEVSRWH